MLRIENDNKEDITSQNNYEEFLQISVGKAINEVLCRKDTFPFVLQENIGFVSNKESDKSTDGIDIIIRLLLMPHLSASVTFP